MTILIIVLVAIALLGAITGNLMSLVEKPEYTRIKSKHNVEVRDYPPMIFAEVEVSGKRKEAIRAGFKLLANFIFGNNTSNLTMQIGRPENEKMAMTAPVFQAQNKDKWKIRFFMAKKYSLETIPKPNCKQVQLVSVPAKRVAVIRFSGFATDRAIQKYTTELRSYLSAESLKPAGEPTLAFYNPPWTLPFLRHNEVMIEVTPKIKI